MRIFLLLLLTSSYGYTATENHHVALSIMNEAKQKEYIKSALAKINDEFKAELTDFETYLDERALLCEKEPTKKNCKVPVLTKNELKNIYSQRAKEKEAYLSKTEDWKYLINKSEIYFWFPSTQGSEIIKHDISLFHEREIFELLGNGNVGLSKYEVTCDRNIEKVLANCTLNSFPAIEFSGVIFTLIGESNVKLGRLLLNQRKDMLQLHKEHKYLENSTMGEIESYGNEWVIRYQIDLCQPYEVFDFNPVQNEFYFKGFVVGRRYCG